MQFSKQATNIEEQLDLLKSRGLAVDDDALAKRCLEAIGYYRLSAYWLIYEEVPANGATRSKTFRADVPFEQIYKLYVFDRRLRVLLMEAIERIEVHLRSRWTNQMGCKFGPHAYLDGRLFIDEIGHAKQLVRLDRAVKSSSETFIKHYQAKYTQPCLPPIWAVTELMTLGELSKWFSLTKDPKVKDGVARDLGIPTGQILVSILQVLSLVRNICAHHNRLWNRRLVKRFPNVKRWKDDFVLETVGTQTHVDNSVYNVLVAVIKILKKQNVDTSYPNRMKKLVMELSEAQRGQMGFPKKWNDRPVWEDPE